MLSQGDKRKRAPREWVMGGASSGLAAATLGMVRGMKRDLAASGGGPGGDQLAGARPLRLGRLSTAYVLR